MSSCAYWTHLALLLLNCTYMQSNRPQRLSMTDAVTTWHDWQGARTMAKPPNWSTTGLLLLLPLSVYLSVYLFRSSHQACQICMIWHAFSHVAVLQGDNCDRIITVGGHHDIDRGAVGVHCMPRYSVTATCGATVALLHQWNLCMQKKVVAVVSNLIKDHG